MRRRRKMMNFNIINYKGAPYFRLPGYLDELELELELDDDDEDDELQDKW